MGDLTLNKVAGTLLAVALAVMGLRELSHILFDPSSGGHYGHHDEEQTLNERIAETYAYYVTVSDGGAGGGGVVEPVFDLGAALAAADVSRGERSFVAKCAICHSIEQGGANGTGPALWNTIGVPKASHAGFSYSNTLTGMGGEWTYENMNDWLYNPSSYAPGTSMAFAGLRRDDERANVIAYLAQMSENPPAFPDPIPAEAEVIEGAEESGATLEDASIETMEEIELAPEEAPAEIVEDVSETVEDAADTVEDVIDTVEDAIETTTEDVTEPTE